MCICTSLGSRVSLLSFFKKGKFVIGKQTQPATTKRRENHDDEKINRIKELEEKLSYLIEENMPLKQKLLLLTEALWQTRDREYCEAWQIRFSEKQENEKTLVWEKNCHYKNTSLN